MFSSLGLAGHLHWMFSVAVTLAVGAGWVKVGRENIGSVIGSRI
jgi:hypothetical protein